MYILFFYLRKLSRVWGQFSSTALKAILFLHPFLCNFVRPKTSDKDLFEKKKIYHDYHALKIQMLISTECVRLNTAKENRL